MARPAYVLLRDIGTVEIAHSIDLGTAAGVPSTPTAQASDLERLIFNGYEAVREIVLEGGKVLVVLERP